MLAVRHAPISVLLPVYHGTTPDFLKSALHSINQQSLLPEELVVVKDGETTDKVSRTILDFRDREAKFEVRVVVLARNLGLGPALQEGLKHCGNELVARLDDDDISASNRFQVQYDFLTGNRDCSLVGSWLNEFGREGKSRSIKRVPLGPEEIRSYARYRNPINHPSVMYRKTDVIRAGGYRNMPFFEDYDLWVRMIRRSMSLANLPQCLVFYRMDAGFFSRRHGRVYLEHQLKFFRNLRESGFISGREFYTAMALRSYPFLLPPALKSGFYSLLRKF